MISFSLIIPTYKRPESLAQTLESVLANSVIPNETIIIDDDMLTDEYVDDWKYRFAERGVVLIYHKKDHEQHQRGLSESKNLGLELAQHDIVFYLDDDVVVDSEYFANIISVWDANNDDSTLFAVGGKILNNRTQGRFERAFSKFFGLRSATSWDVTPVGFQVWDQSVTEKQRAYYLHGGVSSYQKALVQQIGFPVFSGGRTGLEDVAVALQAKQQGLYSMYVPTAMLDHYHAAAGRDTHFASGVKESVNRRIIFRDYAQQHTIAYVLWFVWSNVGWIIKKFLARQFRYGLGMIVGLGTRISS